jgi:hypothetical protein
MTHHTSVQCPVDEYGVNATRHGPDMARHGPSPYPAGAPMGPERVWRRRDTMRYNAMRNATDHGPDMARPPRPPLSHPHCRRTHLASAASSGSPPHARVPCPTPEWSAENPGSARARSQFGTVWNAPRAGGGDMTRPFAGTVASP